MANKYIPSSTIGPATDSRKPNAFEKIQMWWAEDSTSRENWGFTPNKKGTKWGTIVGSSYSDDDYLTDAQKDAQKSIDNIKKAQDKKDKEERDKANLLFIQDKKAIVGQLAELQKDPIANSGSIQSMIDLLDKKDISELEQGKIDVLLERVRKGETNNPTIAPQPGVPAPVRATEQQPGATPKDNEWMSDYNMTYGDYKKSEAAQKNPNWKPPEKNKPNQYTFADGHKEYDSTAIPQVLDKGRITPARYFAMNGMNFIRDAKKLAIEMGMTDYRGTPGQNYALVNYLEEKKNGNPTAGGEQNRGSNRKFDGIRSDVLPNRFTQEERDKVMAMTPEEQAKYVSERNVADLKKMLPGNVGLINKVFGTNYTSDDLTGGISRATIMGTGMTAKGMEVQKLIDGLNEATANKFMSQGGELDNAVVDNAIMNTSSPQSGRRKILEDMVDGRIPMGQGTTIDSSDTKYMQEYKLHKRVLSNAETYNKMITEWNNMDSNNVMRNKLLVEIQKKVNDIKKNDPEVYAELQKDLDKIPEFISKGGVGKIPTATVTTPGEKAEKEMTTTSKKIEIAPATNNNIPDATDGPYTKANAEKNGGLPKPEVDKGGTILKDNVNQTPTTKTSGGGYVREEPDARYGYSSNSISQG